MPKAFDTADWSIGRPALKAYGKVNELFQKVAYSHADKVEIRDLLD